MENYTYKICDYDSAIVDVAFFDFANDKWYNNILKSHEWLEIKNIKHRINYSGRKVHLYIKLKNAEKCQNLKDALYNFQKWFCEQLNLTFGIENHDSNNNPDIDSKLMGNLAGLTRIPNTFNPAGNRFCIPLTYNMLMSGEDNIKELAKKQQFLGNVWFGKESFDLKNFDIPRFNEFNEQEKINIPLIEIDEDFGNEKFWPCIKKCLVDRSGFEQWFIGALWLREKGFSYKEADEILKKYLSQFKRTDGWNDDYRHMKYSDKTLETVYKDKEQKYKLPRCETMWMKGFCPGRCQHFNTAYFNRKNGQNIN